MESIISPIAAISETFQSVKCAFMPYFTIGYPDLETSIEIIQACANSGANIIELGIPFSDPLADGPTIQQSTQIALDNGTTVEKCLEAVNALRTRGVEIPLMLMGYYNPFLAYGLEEVVTASKDAGANGFIVPDLPPEEADALESLSRSNDLALTYLLSPNSPAERIKLVAKRSTGFIYLVSVTGITGARKQLPPQLEEFAARVRAQTTKPIGVGFGISNESQAISISKFANGVIIGSALVKIIKEAKDPVKASSEFVQNIRIAMDNADNH